MALRKQDYMTSGGRIDKSLANYFDMPETIVRGGKVIDIKEHNAKILGKKKK